MFLTLQLLTNKQNCAFCCLINLKREGEKRENDFFYSYYSCSDKKNKKIFIFSYNFFPTNIKHNYCMNILKV